MSDALVCDVCGGPTQKPMKSFGCKNCFMLWYDSGITDSDVLGAESRWRRENDWWPWGKKPGPTFDQIERFHADLVEAPQ